MHGLVTLLSQVYAPVGMLLTQLYAWGGNAAHPVVCTGWYDHPGVCTGWYDHPVVCTGW